MKYFFGKPITRVFYPVEMQNAANLPTQTPTIYVFRDQPSRAQAAAGTGALQTVSTWFEQNEAPYARTYTLAAINDPDPAGGTESWAYWEAINFKTTTAGQTQTFIRSFDLERARGQDSQPDTTPGDLFAIFPAIKDYYTIEQIQQHIKVALEEFKIDLLARNWQWADVNDLTTAKYIIAYKALASACFSQSKEKDDRFDRRYDEYSKRYEALKAAIPLKADVDHDGKAEAAIDNLKHYVVIER